MRITLQLSKCFCILPNQYDSSREARLEANRPLFRQTHAAGLIREIKIPSDS